MKFEQISYFVLLRSSNLLLIIWYMYRRFVFFYLCPDPPKPEGILRTPRAPRHARGHGEVPEGSQDQRTELEKGEERKLKRNVKKENKKMRFHFKN